MYLKQILLHCYLCILNLGVRWKHKSQKLKLCFRKSGKVMKQFFDFAKICFKSIGKLGQKFGADFATLSFMHPKFKDSIEA